MALGLIVHFLAPGADWVQAVIHYAARPSGTIFLNLLFMMVVPLMFSALVPGVAELGDVASLGRCAWPRINRGVSRGETRRVSVCHAVVAHARA